MLLRQGLLMVAAGAIPGIAGARLTGRFLESLMDGAKSIDLATSAGLALFLALVASTSIWAATAALPDSTSWRSCALNSSNFVDNPHGSIALSETGEFSRWQSPDRSPCSLRIGLRLCRSFVAGNGCNLLDAVAFPTHLNWLSFGLHSGRR